MSSTRFWGIGGLLSLLMAGIATAGSSVAGRSFLRTETDDRYQLAYTWPLSDGSRLFASFSFSKATLDSSEQAFGLVWKDLEADLSGLESRLRMTPELSPEWRARRLLARSRFHGYIEVRSHPSGEIEFARVPGRNSPTEVGGEIEKLTDRLDAEWSPCRAKIRKIIRRRVHDYLRDHGLVRHKGGMGGIGVDYNEVIRRSLTGLKDVAEAIERQAGRHSINEELDAVVAFVQGIPYGEVPVEMEGRYSAGFLVPFRVLLDDRGDCDSKAVLFAGIWRNIHRSRIILVLVPNHVLVGAGLPGAYGATITVGSFRYVLCEVCSEWPLPPGVISRYSAESLQKGIFKVVRVR
jgi:hypothetical protein